MVGVDPDPANNEKIISWTKSYYDALHPYSAGGAYVNFLMGDEGEDRIKKTYGENYERLVVIKNKYDPGNLFRVNQTGLSGFQLIMGGPQVALALALLLEQLGVAHGERRLRRKGLDQTDDLL